VREGWTWLLNSRKWHYVTSVDNKSLCGRFMLLKLPDQLEAHTTSPDNCAECVRRLLLRDAKAGKPHA
jgi:hypothetical protein